jgi:magnesium-transporting ATPase (P-type)
LVQSRAGTACGPAWLKFVQQFHQPLVYILLLAAGVTLFLRQWVDASVILGVVLVNALVGSSGDEGGASHRGVAPPGVNETTVRRDGHPRPVRSESLVPGMWWCSRPVTACPLICAYFSARLAS